MRFSGSLLLTLRELTLATILFSPSNITLSVVIWSLWNSGQHGPSAAMSLVMILLMLPVMIGLLARRQSRRRRHIRNEN